jgi:hypothetical protein
MTDHEHKTLREDGRGGGAFVRRARGASLVMLLAALLLLADAGSPRADGASLEHAIKATYLFKFAPFVTWPPSELQKNTFDVCLNGADGVTKLAPDAAAGQQINGKPITVRNLADGENPEHCQILYVANSAAAGGTLAAARGKPILTVTDGLPSDHGIIGFTIVQGHVRFDIDTGLAAGAGLSISSKLLSLANAVTPAPEERR